MADSTKRSTCVCCRRRISSRWSRRQAASPRKRRRSGCSSTRTTSVSVFAPGRVNPNARSSTRCDATAQHPSGRFGRVLVRHVPRPSQRDPLRSQRARRAHRPAEHQRAPVLGGSDLRTGLMLPPDLANASSNYPPPSCRESAGWRQFQRIRLIIVVAAADVPTAES